MNKVNNKTMANKNKGNRLKNWHKWIGLPLTFFSIFFALSGLVLNHRQELSGIDISRGILPSYFHINNWNLGSVKSTINIGGDSILMYGGSGIWITDSKLSYIEEFHKGIKEGADNHNIAKIISASQNNIYAVSTFDLYQLNRKTNHWDNISKLLNNNERLTDIAYRQDTLVVMSRSEIFTAIPPYKHFEKRELATPKDYINKVSLFKTIWALHSGELFGIAGKIFVDFLAILTIIISISGVIIFIFPKLIRKLKRQNKSVQICVSTLRPSYKLHNSLGYWFAAFLFILFLSGTFLRPPLLITIIKSKIPPLINSSLDSENAWNDKLRSITYDTLRNEWLIYSSEGFYSIEGINEIPQKINRAPKVSVMGVSVMKQINEDNWIIGSFDGLVIWNRCSGSNINYFTNQPLAPKSYNIPDENLAITGFSSDFNIGDIIFSYTTGATNMPDKKQFIDMPNNDTPGRISLWHLALEVHSGRIYFSGGNIYPSLFIFISGISLCLLVITGFIMYRKR